MLARTSNPEGGQVQTASVPGGRIVAQSIVDDAAAENASGTSTVGLVVGATRSHGLDLAALNGPILSPGLGAQGATAADIPEVFAGADTRWCRPPARVVCWRRVRMSPPCGLPARRPGTRSSRR